jgi:hypothetical protein
MAISISLTRFLVNGEFRDFTITKNGQRITVPVGSVNPLEISGNAVRGEGSCAGHELNTRATVVILKQNQFLVNARDSDVNRIVFCFLHGIILTLFSEMSNSFYARHTLLETWLTFKHGQVMFTDTTRTVALLTGLVTVTTVKVIVDRFTVNVAEELIGVPFGHKLEGSPLSTASKLEPAVRGSPIKTS